MLNSIKIYLVIFFFFWRKLIFVLREYNFAVFNSHFLQICWYFFIVFSLHRIRSNESVRMLIDAVWYPIIWRSTYRLLKMMKISARRSYITVWLATVTQRLVQDAFPHHQDFNPLLLLACICSFAWTCLVYCFSELVLE